MSLQRKVKYRTNLFDPENLSSSQNIEDALDEFASVINKGNYVQTFEGLLDRDYIIELVVSGIGEHVPLKQWMLEDFSHNAKTFETSITCRILGRLYRFLQFHSSSESITTHRDLVELAPKGLLALSNMSFLEQEGKLTHHNLATKKTKQKGSQREVKVARRAAYDAATVDHRLFAALHIPIPKTTTDAEKTCEELLARLKVVLTVFFEDMRHPKVVETVKAFFIHQTALVTLQTINTDVSNVQHKNLVPAAPTTEEHPAAYPMVQPLKGALYFDTPEGFGNWRIYLASRASADLRRYHDSNPKVFETVKNTIKSLSQGNFPPDKHKPLKGSGTIVPVYEAKMGGDLRLIYIIDCISDYDNTSERQAIRIFGVYTHAQIDNRLWTSVSLYLSNRNPAYRQRCLQRQYTPGGDRYCFEPITFVGSAGDGDSPAGSSKNEIPSLPGDDSNELHQIVSLEKYVMLSQELLYCIETNRPASFPFELSSYEQTIVQHPYSCYVLGRSGTGKTTTMLFKMLLHERSYQLSGSPNSRPRQMFVTKSRVLARKVEEQFVAYFTTLLSASHTEHLYPSSTILSQSANIGNDQDIMTQEVDDECWESRLPQQLSKLEDHHFPLFIPFEKLCSMIEADIEDSMSTVGKSYLLRGHSSHSGANLHQGTFVTYDRFLSHYWSRFSHNLKKNLHPSSVFSEFMGIIAGSEAAIISESGYLSREEYRRVSTRAQIVFIESRDVVYDLYMAFRKIKTELGDIDLAERTQNIIRSFSASPSLLQKVSHLYVDETQDNLLIDTLLLRMLCSSSGGLFWAGDTAQTISAGSAFRFNELKAFQYRIEEKRRKNARNLPLGCPREPKMFQLAINFRSHAGIVNCAHAIIQLITTYWKTAIDVLQPERGKASGAKPIFYKDIYAGYVHEGHFMKRGAQMGPAPVVELGAHQCILVRDNSAKERLTEKMGRDIGLILTLYESKGLEFNDVFLYNFFQDSTVQASHWRLLLNNVSGSRDEYLGPAPAFDPARHAALCSELKCLYVAITRARNNLRIGDESDIGGPMRTLWASRGFIVTCSPGEETRDFAVPSENKDDWADRAKSFFDNGQWLLAKQCYDRAGRKHSAAVANSYYLQEVASRTPVDAGGAKRKQAFTSAAEAFASCSAHVVEPHTKSRYLRRSGECFEEGLMYLRAAQTYREGGFLDKAVLCFKKAGSFDDIYHIIRHSSDQLDSETLDAVRDVTRLHYVAKRNYERVHQLFNDVDEEKEFLEDRNLDMAQVDLMLLHGRKIEAAELHLVEGRIFEAIDLFLEDGSEAATSRAKACILRGLWKLMPLGIIPKDEEETRKLFDRYERIPDGGKNDRAEAEILMFRLIQSRSIDELCRMADTFLRLDDLKAALLCLDHVFLKPPQLSNQNLNETESHLRRFSVYVRMLRDFSVADDPLGDSRVPTLFGLQVHDDVDGSVEIPSESPIASHVDKKKPKESGLMVKRETFVLAFRQCLQARLLDRVVQENDAARQQSDLQTSPCIRHVVHKDCQPEFPCPRPHLVPDERWHTLFINVHLLQIVIYQSIAGLQYPSEMKSQQKFWILKLYEVLNPASHHFGPTCSILQQSLQGVPAATSIVLDWVRSLSFTLEFGPRHAFLTIVMQCATIAFALDKKEAASFMARCQFVTSSCPLEYLRGPSRRNSLQELLVAMDPNNRSSVATGIQFLCHIVQVESPVNMPVLCSFIERICTQLIVCSRLQGRGDLHSVILPRTWLANLLSNLDLVEARHQDCSYFWPLLRPLRILLRALFFPSGQSPMKIEPEFRSLDRQSKNVRGVYIARICRVLGLLGLNTQAHNFRQDILEIFWSIRRDQLGHGFSPLYGGYFYSEEDFYNILKTTRRSLLDSPFDNMVQLLHADRTQHPVTEIFGLSRIIYSKPEELLERLQGFHFSVKLDPSIQSPSQTQPDPATVSSHSEPIEEEDLNVDDDTPITKPEDENFIPDTIIDQSLYLGHSQHDINSARIIQKVYRTYKDRKNSLEGVDHGARTRHWFAQYRDAIRSHSLFLSKDMSILYLGPISHLLAILDAVQYAIPRVKRQLSKALIAGNSNQEVLEEISFKQTTISNASKDLKRFLSLLAPTDGSTIPLDRTLLQKNVEEILGIVMSIQPHLRLGKDVNQGLLLVEKGVLQHPKPPQSTSPSVPSGKKRRPALVMDDLLDLMEDELGR